VNTEKALNSTIDYLIDDDFINHVINGTPYLKKFCRGAAYQEAKRILLATDDDIDVGFDVSEIVALRNRIFNTLGLVLEA
jgi:hypothetical protein